MRALLGLHVSSAAAWLTAATMLAALESPFATRLPDVDRPTRMALLFCAGLVLMTGCELARRWRTHWPAGVTMQLFGALVVLALTGTLVLVDTTRSWMIRLAQVVVLIIVFGISAAYRATPVSPAGRHRAPSGRKTSTAADR